MLQWIFGKKKKEVVKPVEIIYKYNDLGHVAYKEYGHTVNKNENFYFDKNKINASNTLG
jgi:hypothetical protein